MSDPGVTVLIPARNESDRIAQTIAACREIPGVRTVIVSDDASVDDTARAAAEAGATVVSLERRSGKGQALNAALAVAKDQYDVLLLLDADIGVSAIHARDLVSAVRAATADLAVAVLPPPPGRGGLGTVVGLARWAIHRMTGFRPRAPLSGQRALSSAAVERLTPFERGYGVEVAMTVRALRAGLRVVEVDVPMSHRYTARDLPGFGHRGKQLLHVAVTLARLLLERR